MVDAIYSRFMPGGEPTLTVYGEWVGLDLSCTRLINDCAVLSGLNETYDFVYCYFVDL